MADKQLVVTMREDGKVGVTQVGDPNTAEILGLVRHLEIWARMNIEVTVEDWLRGARFLAAVVLDEESNPESEEERTDGDETKVKKPN